MEAASFDPRDLAAHAEGLRRLARGMLGEAQADDVVQQAMVRAMERPPLANRPLRPWLATVTRNLALDFLRGEKRRSRREEAATTPAPAASPAEHVGRAEAHQQAVSALLELPEPYRECLILRYLEDCSAPETAQQMNLPVTTVRTRLKRGLAMLRERLDVGHPDGARALCALLLTGGLDTAPPPAMPAPSGGGLLPWVLAGTMLLAGGAWVIATSGDGQAAQEERQLSEEMRENLRELGYIHQLQELGYSGD